MNNMNVVKKGGLEDISGKVLGVGLTVFFLGIIAGGGWALWNGAKKTDEVGLINLISTEMTNLNPKGGYGTSDYSATLINSGTIPSNVKVVGGKIYNRFGGAITPTGNGLGFSVSDTLLPAKICIGLITGTNTSDMQSTVINNTSFTTTVTALDATTACSGDSNTVTFNFKS